MLSLSLFRRIENLVASKRAEKKDSNDVNNGNNEVGLGADEGDNDASYDGDRGQLSIGGLDHRGHDDFIFNDEDGDDDSDDEADDVNGGRDGVKDGFKDGVKNGVNRRRNEAQPTFDESLSSDANTNAPSSGSYDLARGTISDDLKVFADFLEKY